MANQNSNGRNAMSNGRRPSWRIQDQGRDEDRGRWSRDSDDDDRYVSDRGRSMRDEDRDDRSTEHYGQGQSGYTSGRIGEDRSLGFENRNQGHGRGYEDREGGGMGLDDRWSGRNAGRYDRGDRGWSGGHEGYGRQQEGMGQRGFGAGDRGYGGGDRGFGGAERMGYNSGYNQGGFQSGGYGGHGDDRRSRDEGYGAQGPRQGHTGGGMQGMEYGGGRSGAWGRGHEGSDEDQGMGYGEDRGLGGHGQGYGMQQGYGGSSTQGQRSYGAMQGSPQNRGQGGPGDVGYSGGYGGGHRNVERHFGGQRDWAEQQRGLHRGKGPKGFTRSDERIREMVCEALSDDDHIDATHIDITVKNGEVTLTGTVPDRRMKRMAEDCVERVSGVKDVSNQVKVSSQADVAVPESKGTPTVMNGAKDDASSDKKHRA